MNSKILQHEAFIELILLIILLIIYYTTNIPIEHKTICLLGTYILLKFSTKLLHYIFHSKKGE